MDEADPAACIDTAQRHGLAVEDDKGARPATAGHAVLDRGDAGLDAGGQIVGCLLASWTGQGQATRDLENGGDTGRVVVGAVVRYSGAVGVETAGATGPQMIVVRADHDVLPGERGVAALEHADDVSAPCPRERSSVCGGGVVRDDEGLVPAGRAGGPCQSGLLHPERNPGRGRISSSRPDAAAGQPVRG